MVLKVPVIATVNGLGVELPAKLVERLQLKEGQLLNIREIGNQIILSATPSHRLDELLQQCTPSASTPADLEIWDKAPPIGGEII